MVVYKKVLSTYLSASYGGTTVETEVMGHTCHRIILADANKNVNSFLRL